jgi:outer membrane protein TolC
MKTINLSKIFISIYVVITIISGNYIYGQDTLTLERCKKLSLENNKELMIAHKTATKTKYDKDAMITNFFPKVSAGAFYALTNLPLNYAISGGFLPTYKPNVITNELTPNIMTDANGNPIVGPDGIPVFKEYAYFPGLKFEIDASNTVGASLLVQQPIFMGGKIIAGYKMTKIGTEMAALNIKLTERDILIKTEEAFWNCVKVRELGLAAQEYRNAVAEVYRIVENAHNVGMALGNDLMTVQLKLNEADLQLFKVKNKTAVASMALCNIIGIPLNTDIIIDDNSSSYNIDLKENDYIGSSGRIEYQLLTKVMELKKEEKNLVRSDFLPNLGIIGAYSYLNGVKINGTKLFDNSFSFSAMVSLNIPILHWGEGINKLRSSKIEEEIASIKREDAMEKMDMEQNLDMSDYYEAIQTVKMMEKSMSQSKENMRVSQDRYKVGTATLASLLEAQAIWQKANADYINAKSQAHIAKSKIEGKYL